MLATAVVLPNPPRLKQLRPDLYALRGWLCCVHLLTDGRDTVMMDTGFLGDACRLRNAVLALGGSSSSLKAILITHGHLDHVANAAALQAWSGAKVYAPAGDEEHLAGRAQYHGLTQFCGLLETLGRAFAQYQPPRVDVWVRDGDELPFWGGLRVVGLPGHTPGHVGFYSASKRVFFTGDVFADVWRLAPAGRLLSVDADLARQALIKAAAFDADLFVPTHYLRLTDRTPARLHAKAEQLRLRR